MADERGRDYSGEFMSPGGFVFGVSGWTWGEQRPVSITFFLDNSAMVCDQHGRPIKGTSNEGKEVWFATKPPEGMMATGGVPPSYQRRYREVLEGGKLVNKTPLATHVEVIAALAAERVDWTRLQYAGMPQLPYEQLRRIPNLQLAEIVELNRIPDPELRKDAIKLKREVDAALQKELATVVE